ncbi:unnamed protein product, partial [Rotaria sp. Silwood2]
KGKGELWGENGVLRSPATGTEFTALGIPVCSVNKCEDVENSNGKGVSCCCNTNLCNFGTRSTVGLSATLLASCLVVMAAIFNH